jgi:hypothetical protein
MIAYETIYRRMAELSPPMPLQTANYVPRFALKAPNIVGWRFVELGWKRAKSDLGSGGG